MKLNSNKVETVVIPKNTLLDIVIMDRLPVFLEIDSQTMPFPCKIILKPNYKKVNYSEDA